MIRNQNRRELNKQIPTIARSTAGRATLHGSTPSLDLAVCKVGKKTDDIQGRATAFLHSRKHSKNASKTTLVCVAQHDARNDGMTLCTRRYASNLSRRTVRRRITNWGRPACKPLLSKRIARPNYTTLNDPLSNE